MGTFCPVRGAGGPGEWIFRRWRRDAPGADADAGLRGRAEEGICYVSGIYLSQGGLDLAAALPYLAGGAVGGWIGGHTFHAVPSEWLRRGFGLLLLYGGVRNLL